MPNANEIADLVDKATEGLVQELVLELHGELVERTPVDTGHARANWLPSVDKPVESVAGTPQAVDSGAATPGLLRVAAWKLVDRHAYISNNVPYINRLNAGHSNQAPAGFVEKAVQAVILGLQGKRIQ